MLQVHLLQISIISNKRHHVFLKRFLYITFLILSICLISFIHTHAHTHIYILYINIAFKEPFIHLMFTAKCDSNLFKTLNIPNLFEKEFVLQTDLELMIILFWSLEYEDYSNSQQHLK